MRAAVFVSVFAFLFSAQAQAVQVRHFAFGLRPGPYDVFQGQNRLCTRPAGPGGSLRFDSQGGGQFRVATAQYPTGIAEGGGLAELTGAFPNPSTGEVRVSYSLPAAMPVALEVFDPSGRRVGPVLRFQGSAGPGTVPVEVTDRAGHAPAAGIYWIRLHLGTETRSCRVLVVPR